MTHITVGIVAVPERRKLVQRIISNVPHNLNQDFFPYYDTTHSGSWYGHLGAMNTIPSNATHHLVIEDDVSLCADFMHTLYAAVEANPNNMISIYASRAQSKKVEWAHRNKTAWFVDDCGASGQGVLFPRKLLFEFILWCDRYCPDEMPYEDTRLWGWMYENRLLMWNTVPALIEHTLPMNSSLGFNNKGKIAADFLGDDPRTIDFTLPSNPHIFKYEGGKKGYTKWTGRYKERNDG